MTTPTEHADLEGAVERLTRASNTFPVPINCEGIGTIRVRQGDVFAVLGQVEAQAALIGEIVYLTRENLSTLEWQAYQTRGRGKSTCELDSAIEKTRAVLAKVTAR